MKKLLFIGLLCACAAASAQIRVQYETEVAGPDLAGSSFNAAFQAALTKGDKVRLGKEFQKPRFRAIVRSLAIEELSREVSMWEVLWLLDQVDETTLFLNAWTGYSGVDRAPSMAGDVAKAILADLEALKK